MEIPGFPVVGYPKCPGQELIGLLPGTYLGGCPINSTEEKGSKTSVLLMGPSFATLREGLSTGKEGALFSYIYA